MQTIEAVRALVTVETVISITEIENADFIAIAKVRGWNLVAHQAVDLPLIETVKVPSKVPSSSHDRSNCP